MLNNLDSQLRSKLFLLLFLWISFGCSHNITKPPSKTYSVHYFAKGYGFKTTIEYTATNSNDQVKLLNWTGNTLQTWGKNILGAEGQSVSIKAYNNGIIDINNNSYVYVAIYVNNILISEVDHKHMVGISFYLDDQIFLKKTELRKSEPASSNFEQPI